VKNGDRWAVTKITKTGVQARHLASRKRIWLPAEYVAASVELGYASTTHTAQGITADTMHGMLTGAESRQQAYTMLTRGRLANHAYLTTVGDGDPHTAIDPTVVNPLSPTDILERILGRDESPVSATTLLREAADPRKQLKDAVDRYADAITFAADHLASDVGIRALGRRVDAVLPGLTEAPGWQALCSELALVQADGRDPIAALSRARQDPLSTSHDPASVLAWRLADTEWRGRRGPLPWLPAIPSQLLDHPAWGDYLAARSRLVSDLADTIHGASHASQNSPGWLSSIAGDVPVSLIADVELWRAAHGIPTTDARPTGDRQHEDAAARWQRHLNTRLNVSRSAALDEWRHVFNDITPTLLVDPFTPTLARRLSQLSSSGIPTRGLLDNAANEGPLPDDHAAAALWWRISRHITPAVAQDVDSNHHLAAHWLDTFSTALGADTTSEIQASPWWPALVATIERGLQRGWTLGTLLADARNVTDDGHLDRAQAWVWRLSLLTDPIPPTEENDATDFDEPPADLWDGYTPRDPNLTLAAATDLDPTGAPEEAVEEFDSIELSVEAALAIEAQIRNGLGIPEPTDADIRRMLDRADMIRTSPVTPERIAQLNEMAATYYERCYPDSWAQSYLIERFRTDLTGHPWIRPGYAPDGWTGLIDHLRRRGVTDTELITAGLASATSTGRLIDRFRDRVVFPITHQRQVLGFVGRRNPTLADSDQKGPKYLNTAETPLYRKGAQLYAAADPLDAVPVVVEGPLDAIAVTLASNGRQVGLAPLGTSLTDEQAAQLHAVGRTPVIATDADRAGRAAAARDYWVLTSYGIDPLHARLPESRDPADLVAEGAHGQLQVSIDAARPLADTLLDDLLGDLFTADDALYAIRVLAAQPPARWAAGVERLAVESGLPSSFVKSSLLSVVCAWNANPRKAGQQAQAVRVDDHSSAHSTAAVGAPQDERDRSLPYAVRTVTAPGPSTTSAARRVRL
jgi:DNA primase catalytic core